MPVYGVGHPAGPGFCWFGSREWQTTGEPGLELGQDLWDAFLGAGGPWPTEFILRACPADGLPEPQGTWTRQGPRCRHGWELIPDRERIGWI